VDRLLRPSARDWEVIGRPAPGPALVACAGSLFSAGTDGVLHGRELCGQNLTWRAVDAAPALAALAAPREAVPGVPLGLFGATVAGALVYRDATLEVSPWLPLEGATTPPGVTGLACLDGWLYAATANGGLHHLPAAKLGDAPQWTPLPDRLELRGLTAVSGLLIGLGADGEVYWRRPVAGAAPWVRLCAAPEGAVALAGGAGMLVASADRLRWRAATG
jgi:hypothetical protein